MRLLVLLLLALVALSSAQYISKAQFECILPHTNHSSDWVRAFNDLFTKYEITTPKRIVAFVTQAIVQTDNFSSMVEYTGRHNASCPWGCNQWCHYYDGGCQWIGRGILQIHGRNNYVIAEKHANVLFTKFPELMADMPYSFDESGYFWYRNNMNHLAETGNWLLMAKLLAEGQPQNLPSRNSCRERVSKCYRPPAAIPSRCGFTYTCQEGDDIETITTRYRLLTSEIFYWNPDLPSTFFLCQAGQKLFIAHC